MLKTNQIIIKCTDEFKGEIKKFSELEGLTMSAYITRLIKLRLHEDKNERAVHKRS